MSSGNSQESLKELQALLVELCEGSLDSAGYRRIEALVRSGPSAHQLYIETMLLHGELRWASIHSPNSANSLNDVAGNGVGGNAAEKIVDPTEKNRVGLNLPLGLLPADAAAGSPLLPEASIGEFGISGQPSAFQSSSAGSPERRSIAAAIGRGNGVLNSLGMHFLRGTGLMSRAAAIVTLVGTLCTGMLLGALAVAAVPLPQRSDDAGRNAEVTLLGSTGAGFTTALFHSPKQGSVNPKSDSPALPSIAPRDYVHTVSNETLPLFGPTPKRVIWQLRFTGGLLDSFPGNRRVVLGVRSGETPASNLFLPGSGDPAQAGLWVFLTNGTNITPYTIKLATHGNLVFVDAAGEAQLLATWDWAEFDMSAHPNITVNLDTSATHYALSFDQEVINLTGSLSGKLPSVAPPSIRIGVFDQIGEGDVPGSIVVDRIAIANLAAAESRRFHRASSSIGKHRESQ